MDYLSKYIPNAFCAITKVVYDKYLDYTNNDTFNANTKRLNKQPSYYIQLTHFLGDPAHIIDNLYLGSAYNAASFYRLKEIYKINIIINATKEISNYYPNDFFYKNYDLADVNDDSISKHLKDAYNFIELNKDKKILIHCFMGASRSASLMCYYIMKKYNRSLDEVVDFIVEKRKIVNINTTFADELKNSIILNPINK